MATNHSQQIVQKLWNYCNVLRDDGLSYGDYLEQLPERLDGYEFEASRGLADDTRPLEFHEVRPGRK